MAVPLAGDTTVLVTASWRTCVVIWLDVAVLVKALSGVESVKAVYVAAAVLVMGGVAFSHGTTVLTWKVSTSGVTISSAVPGSPSGPSSAAVTV